MHIIEHMILWGQECWRKQRGVKSYGRQTDKGWSVPCSNSSSGEVSPIGKKSSTLPNGGLKSPGRKCSHEGKQVCGEEATFRETKS